MSFDAMIYNFFENTFCKFIIHYCCMTLKGPSPRAKLIKRNREYRILMDIRPRWESMFKPGHSIRLQEEGSLVAMEVPEVSYS